jgi:hypothetical protein
MGDRMFLIKSDKSADISANYVERMSPESLPWKTSLYYLTGRQDIGRPRRRWAHYF